MCKYDDDYPTCAETFATLRFYHADGSPETVTETLGIAPSKSQVRGTNVFSDKQVRRPISGWFLCSKGEVESKDVRRHIDWILDRIRGLESGFERLQSEGWRTDISCYWLGIGHGGPMLDPSQMADLAKLNLECGFDVYSRDDSEPASPFVRREVVSPLNPSALVGQPLSIVRHAANVLNLHFGEVTRTHNQSWGQYAIHVQATWRLLRDSKILVGSSDRWNPVEEVSDWDAWYESPHPSREDVFWESFIGGVDPVTHSFEGEMPAVTVIAVDENRIGDLVIGFSDGSKLEVYGCGTDDEFWRLFEPREDTPHYVVGTYGETEQSLTPQPE